MAERKCESLMATTVTQEAKYRQSLVLYAKKNGVSKASRKYNRARSVIYFWLARYDGTWESLTNRSKQPHSHPNQHTQQEYDLILRMRRRNPDLGLIELWSRLLIVVTHGVRKSVSCAQAYGRISAEKEEISPEPETLRANDSPG